MSKHMKSSRMDRKEKLERKYKGKSEKKQSRHIQKSNKIILFFRVISLIIIVICIYNIVNWYIENRKNNNIIDDLSKYTNSTKIIVIGEETVPVSKIDFDELLAKNGDVIGWLTVKGTKINYPVVHYTDNDFYLNHSFDKSYNSAGWIFANYINKVDGTDKNISIFGHNRRDGSMFCTLKDTIKKEWYTNEDNYCITFDTPNGTEIYKVFSNYQIKSESYYLTNNFKDNAEYKEFLNTITDRSVYNYGIKPNENDKIITLSTCANDNRYRVVLHAVKIN